MPNNNFKFGARSLKNREGVRPELIAISDLALQLSLIDFGIPESGGMRTFLQQRKLFDEKKSRADGRFKISAHQTGWALDFYAIVDGKPSWHPPHLAIVAAAFLQAASILGHPLEWGGFWSNKGKTPIDGIKYGWDCAHVQIKRAHYADVDTTPSHG